MYKIYMTTIYITYTKLYIFTYILHGMENAEKNILKQSTEFNRLEFNGE